MMRPSRSSRPCAAAAIALWICAGCGTPGPAKPPGGGPVAPQAADAGGGDAGGGGGGGAGAVPLDRDYGRLADRAVAMYEAVAEAFRAAGKDCPKATARVGELTAAYRDVVSANGKVLREGRARELKQALAKHGDRFDAAAKAIIESETMATCTEDPAFTKAFDDLVGAPP